MTMIRDPGVENQVMITVGVENQVIPLGAKELMKMTKSRREEELRLV